MADMAFRVVTAESGIGVPVHRSVLLHLVGRIAGLVVVLAFVVLDRGRIAGPIGQCCTCRDAEQCCGQHDRCNSMSHAYVLAKWLVGQAPHHTAREAPIPDQPGSGRTGSFIRSYERSGSRERKHRELATERGVVLQRGVAADRAEAFCRLGEPCRKADAGPAADAGEHGDVLLAVMLVRGHIADDAGRSLELVELLAGLGVHGLEIALKRSVEHHAARGRECAGPDRELLGDRPDDLSGLGIPGNEVAHVALAGRRIHRQGRAHIGLARGVAHLERLVVHADVVGRHVEQASLRRV